MAEPLVLGAQGSFFFGGQVLDKGQGDTFNGDAGYVKFQAPVNPKALPLILWHGGGQFGKTWETTPDGREGYQQIFVRRGYAVYVLDQARRGGASRSVNPDRDPYAGSDNSFYYNIFRLGVWAPPAAPRPFAGLSFPTDPASIDQFWFQITDNMGGGSGTDEVRALHANNLSDLLDRTGPSILITHSQSGQYGWASAIRRPDAIKAVVSYEPNIYAFPSDDPPPEISTAGMPVADFTPPQLVDPAAFEALAAIPIQVVFGDYVRDQPRDQYGAELWRRVAQRAEQFADAVNRRGGKVEILHLPDAGLTGNTHFPFADLNNLAVADQLSAFLARHGLDA